LELGYWTINIMIIHLIIIWAFADLILTLCFVNHPGFYEINPIARFLISKGLENLIFFKIIATAMVCLMYAHFLDVKKEYKRSLIIAFLFVVVVWGFYWVNFLITIWG